MTDLTARHAQVGSKYKLMLASTLNTDGSATPNHFEGVRNTELAPFTYASSMRRLRATHLHSE